MKTRVSRTLIYLDEYKEVEAYLFRENKVWCVDVARHGNNIENIMIDPKADGDILWLLVENQKPTIDHHPITRGMPL